MAVQEFLERLTAQAVEARDKGDTATLNALAADPSIRHFLDNVALLPTMDVEQYGYWYKNHYAHLTTLAEQYEQAEQQQARVDTLEKRLDKLSGMLEALLEVQTAKQKAAVIEAAAEKPVEDDAQTDDTDEDGDEQPDEDDGEEAEAPRGDEPQGDAEDVEAD